MIVGEYEAKFKELSKFFSDLKHSHDEAWKACHFKSSLRSEIREKVVALEIRNFSQLANKYRIAEISIQETKLERERDVGDKRKRENTFGESGNQKCRKWRKEFKKVKKKFGKKPYESSNQPQKQGNTPGERGSRTCYRCGQ